MLVDYSKQQLNEEELEVKLASFNAQQVTGLNLSGNQLEQIPRIVHEKFHNLFLLDLSHNHIRMCEAVDDLAHLTKLETIAFDPEEDYYELKQYMMSVMPSLLYINNEPTIVGQVNDGNEQVYYNGSEVLEAVLQYYRDLLEKLRENELSYSDYLQLAHAFHKLNDQLHAALQDAGPAKYKHLVQKSKFSLFRKYSELIVEAQRRQNMEIAAQLETAVSEHCMNDETQTQTITVSPLQASTLTLHPPTDTNTYSEENDNSYLERNIETKPIQMVPFRVRLYRLLASIFPILVWLPEYRNHLHDIKNDFMAGLTVGVMVIPQGMAYALVAGLPPVYGLYTALIPVFIYALLGTSYHLAVGPTAVSALLIATGLSSLSLQLESGSTAYVAYAILFSLICGTIQLLLGLCRLGFFVNFLSRPVLSGFTSAAAIIIAASQLNHFFGMTLPKDHRLHEIIWNVSRSIRMIHLPTLALSIAAIAFLFFFDRFYLNLTKDLKIKFRSREVNLGRQITLKKIPAGLLLVVISIIIFTIINRVSHYNSAGRDVFGIKIVGTIPRGLPKPMIPSMPGLTWKVFQEVFLACIPIAILGFVEAISIAKFFAMQKGYNVNANQELIAIGTSNLIGGCFQSFPSNGSISRSAVNAGAKAATPLSGIISGILVLVTLWFLTKLFFYLPMPVLSAMIIYSCTKIPDLDQAIFTWKTKKRDCLLLVTAFLATLFIGITEGILIAVIASLFLVIYRSSRPRFRAVGRVPETTVYQDLKYDKSLIVIPGVVVCRFDAEMYFANVDYFKNRMKGFVQKSKYPVYAIVIDCAGINQIDSAAVDALREVKNILDLQEIELYLAQMKETVRKVIARAPINERLKDYFFDNLHEAVLYAEYSTKRRVNAKRMAEENQRISVSLKTSPQSDHIVIEISSES